MVYRGLISRCHQDFVHPNPAVLDRKNFISLDKQTMFVTEILCFGPSVQVYQCVFATWLLGILHQSSQLSKRWLGLKSNLKIFKLHYSSPVHKNTIPCFSYHVIWQRFRFLAMALKGNPERHFCSLLEEVTYNCFSLYPATNNQFQIKEKRGCTDLFPKGRMY